MTWTHKKYNKDGTLIKEAGPVCIITNCIAWRDSEGNISYVYNSEWYEMYKSVNGVYVPVFEYAKSLKYNNFENQVLCSIHSDTDEARKFLRLIKSLGINVHTDCLETLYKLFIIRKKCGANAIVHIEKNSDNLIVIEVDFSLKRTGIIARFTGIVTETGKVKFEIDDSIYVKEGATVKSFTEALEKIKKRADNLNSDIVALTIADGSLHGREIMKKRNELDQVNEVFKCIYMLCQNIPFNELEAMAWNLMPEDAKRLYKDFGVKIEGVKYE